MWKNKGFTLVELMIVVAIIGIIAAIAIPNYMGFVSKTRRSEVKSNLDAIYRAEISYFGESDTFSNSFNAIRWIPVGVAYYTYSVGTELYGRGEADPGLPIAPGADTRSFTACGWGNIDNDPLVDSWYTNETKVLQNMAGYDDLIS